MDVGFDQAGLGYGYLAGDLNQLAEYASWQLGDLRAAASQPRSRHDDTASIDGGGRYGDGLILDEKELGGDQATVASHSGAVPGFFSHLAVSPDRDLGVVVLANSYGELRSAQMAGVVESFADEVMGADAAEPPGSGSYLGVIAGGLGVVVLLLLGVLWVTVGLVRRDSPRRSRFATAWRVLLAAIVGAALLAGGLLGVPALVGAPFGVAALWVPDLTLIFWAALGLVFVLTALTIVREVSWNAAFAELWAPTGRRAGRVDPDDRNETPGQL